MGLKLDLLFKDGLYVQKVVCVLWQDIHCGFDVLYYETPVDEKGKGSFIRLEELQTWRVALLDYGNTLNSNV